MDPEQWEIDCDRDEGTTVEFSVRIPEDDVSEQRKQAMNELKQQVEEPGFRKGKVPDSIIEKKYSPQLKQTILEKLVPSACQEAYQRHDIRPIDEPSIQDFDINGEFFMEASVEEQPSVEVDEDQYTGIPVEKVERTVDEDAIQEQLDRMLENASSLEPIEEDREIETGDFVKLDFAGHDDEGAIVEGTEAEGTVVEVGSQRFLPEIEEGIVGAEVGDHLEIEASFPDDFVDDNLAGETLTFHVDVKEIQEQQLPEPEDEEFLEEMGADSLEELKDNMREQLADAGERDTQQQLAEQVYDHLLDTVEFDVPDTLVEREIDGIIQQQKQQLEQQGRDFEDYLEEQGKTESELREESEDEAVRRIRLTLIFQAIAEKEEISVTDEEFEDHLKELGAQFGVSPDELKEQLPPQQLQNIRFELRDEKILDDLIDRADVETVSAEQEETDETD